MTDVTTGQSQEPTELSAADEQVLRELTERAPPHGESLAHTARISQHHLTNEANID